MLKALVLEHREEAAPRCVGNGFRKMVVPDHAFNIKRLDRDDLVLAPILL